MREKIAKVIKVNVTVDSDEMVEHDSALEAADAVLALEVPVWCDFYGRKCTGNICAVSAKPETCHHKSSKTIADLIGGPK